MKAWKQEASMQQFTMECIKFIWLKTINNELFHIQGNVLIVLTYWNGIENFKQCQFKSHWNINDFNSINQNFNILNVSSQDLNKLNCVFDRGKLIYQF